MNHVVLLVLTQSCSEMVLAFSGDPCLLFTLVLFDWLLCIVFFRIRASDHFNFHRTYCPSQTWLWSLKWHQLKLYVCIIIKEWKVTRHYTRGHQPWLTCSPDAPDCDMIHLITTSLICFFFFGRKCMRKETVKYFRVDSQRHLQYSTWGAALLFHRLLTSLLSYVTLSRVFTGSSTSTTHRVPLSHTSTLLVCSISFVSGDLCFPHGSADTHENVIWERWAGEGWRWGLGIPERDEGRERPSEIVFSKDARHVFTLCAHFGHKYFPRPQGCTCMWNDICECVRTIENKLWSVLFFPLGRKKCRSRS